MKYKITNIVNADVVIEDLSIRLSGKGKSIVIDAITADKSRDLIANRHLIRIDRVGEAVQVPIWPFSKDKVEPAPIKESVKNITKDDISEIKLLLASILSKMNDNRDIKTIIIEKSGIIVDPTMKSEEPLFIPSKIIPDQAEVSIKLKENEILGNDLSRGVQALKKLRSKVK